MDPARLDGVLQRAQMRDPQALTALVDAYSERVFGLLFRLTRSRELAEELTQDTFVRVVRTIADYQHSGRFEPWLFRIAANLARDRVRQCRRRGVTLSLDVPGGEEPRGLPGESLMTRDEPPRAAVRVEDRQRLTACLDRLAAEDREILLLRHFSELPFREIAEMLGIPLGTALARAHRALGKLRQEFGDEWDDFRE